MLQCTPNPDNCGGEGGCSGATVELALNYIADITTKKTGGMFTVADVPYSASPHGTCDAVTQGKNPTVGISGWTQMPVNNLEATMNALVKVRVLEGLEFVRGRAFLTLSHSFCSRHTPGRSLGDCRGRKWLGLV